MNRDLRLAVTRRLPRAVVFGLVLALSAPAAGTSAQPRVAASANTSATIPAAWSGRYDLYRKGVFSSQRTYTWCVAASIQMMLNIIDGTSDHSRDRQERYIRYARKHDQFADPAITGTDGQGWVESLNHFGERTNYHIVSSKTYAKAIRSAVRRLRATGEPVGLVINHHNHAWVMTGFESSTDPAVDRAFQTSAIYIMGPLYPRPQHNGTDPPPDTRISYERMKAFLNEYRGAEAAPNNPWEGLFVTIQP
jgi:hypothetical protein